MVPTSGRKRTPVSEELLEAPYRFDFFQAVRLLEQMGVEAAREGAGTSGLSVGKDHAPNREAVRFRALPSLGFPAGAIAEIRPAAQPDAAQPDAAQPEQRPPEMVTTFMGLTGPNGVLPQHYTRMLIERIRDKDFALRDFLDLFHHRVISLFYRAWEKYRFPIGYERASRAGGDDSEDFFTACLYCLLGLGTGRLRGRMEFDDEALLFYSGHFARYPRSAVALQMMLSDYFEFPIRVEQFQGQWLYLSEEDQSSLPCPRWPRGLNVQLGSGVVIGDRVWDIEGKFRLRLGPLSYDQFRSLMPTGDVLRPLCQLVRTYVGGQFDFDVQPVLIAAEVPWCRLGGVLPGNGGPDPARLGWNTWIRGRPFDHHVTDAVFSMEGLPWTTQA